MLDNAIKFSPPGGVITVCTTATPSEVEIAVQDSGPGLELEELERATGRFWRSPAQSNVEGSGLGLAIAARTVELGRWPAAPGAAGGRRVAGGRDAAPGGRRPTDGADPDSMSQKPSLSR